ncbi:MAG TPA: hypothetical protein PLR60_02645 [Syntrophorhabdaceae bacterium]|nr:hypothetical protein [Syntrophorhabdaceae bacterium]
MMRRTFILTAAFFICFGTAAAGFAGETGKPQQQSPTFSCPRSIAVDVTIKTSAAVAGWDSIPAQSKFSLSIKENAVRGNAMFCHYSNGTVDYNIHRVFPKGRTCYIAPNQSFICQ